jgi:hypothetical protein
VPGAAQPIDTDPCELFTPHVRGMRKRQSPAAGSASRGPHGTRAAAIEQPNDCRRHARRRAHLQRPAWAECVRDPADHGRAQRRAAHQYRQQYLVLARVVDRVRPVQVARFSGR